MRYIVTEIYVHCDMIYIDSRHLHVAIVWQFSSELKKKVSTINSAKHNLQTVVLADIRWFWYLELNNSDEQGNQHI